MKPQYIIKKFSGMWENWLFWCEGFSPEMSWWDINLVNNIGMYDVSGTVWLTNLETSQAMTQFLVGTNTASVTIGSRYLHVFNNTYSTPYQLHDLWWSSSMYFSDLITTKEGDLLYPNWTSSRAQLWRWYRAKATSASATTLVDTTKDFWYLISEYSNAYSDPEVTIYNNKVVNLTKSKEYTVTSIWFTNLETDTGWYTNTYTCPAAISEAAAHRKTWTPSRDISSQVGIWVVSKGAWDITVTVHDSLNTVLSTHSKTAAWTTDGEVNYFYCPAFKDYWPDLHFHVTSTGTTTIKVWTTNDLTTTYFIIRAWDTLNFDTQDPVPVALDEFMLFVDRKYNFDDTVNEVVYPHFANQVTRPNLARQIVPYGDEFFIANGNWMSSLSGEAFSAWAKRMPDNHQLMSLWVNSSSILFSCSFNGKGKLLLWDWYSNGFNNILDIWLPALALTAYDNGWLFLTSWKLYWTDGWSIKKMDNGLDTSVLWYSFFNVQWFNGMTMIWDNLALAWSGYYGDRAMTWVYIYDFNWNWSYQPIKINWVKYYNSTAPKALYVHVLYGIYNSLNTWVSWVSTGMQNLGNWREGNFIYKLKLWEKRRMSMVRLNLTHSNRVQQTTYSGSEALPYTITMSYGKDKASMYTYEQASSCTTTQFTINRTYNRNIELWSEILVIDWANYWQRTFLVSKDNEWTTTEKWNVLPALTTAYNNTLNLKVIDVKKSWTYTVDMRDVKTHIDFDLNDFYSDTLVLEFVFSATTATSIWVSPVEIY